jgi:microsomal dipeptidase-like Zn-dependent dipeptidase
VSKLHDRLIVIDGLNVSNFSRGVFADMRKGGVTAANCTSCVWENFTDTMRNFARWKTWLRDNADLIVQVYTTDDIQRAKTGEQDRHHPGVAELERHRGPPRPSRAVPRARACASCN